MRTDPQAGGEVARKRRIVLTTLVGASQLPAPLASDSRGVSAPGGSARHCPVLGSSPFEQLHRGRAARPVRQREGFASRSAVLHKAVRMLRAAELGSAYEDAWANWSFADDAGLWDSTSADGQSDATR